MNKILLIGSNGQLGWELQRALAPLAPLIICNRQQANLENTLALSEIVRAERPTVIVNAAAYTAVDKAESDGERARRINAKAVDALAREALALDAWLVHYSTDYVFDGRGKRAFREEHPVGPLNVYGQTKLEGENAILHSGCKHLIFRTSWVYATHGANFAKTILHLAKERDELRIIADQVGSPTSAELIADVTAQILGRLLVDSHHPVGSGLYHLVATGETNWYEYARFVIEEATHRGMALRCRSERITPISSAEHPTPARRPANSRLDTQKLQQTFGLVLPHWKFHVIRMLCELIRQEIR